MGIVTFGSIAFVIVIAVAALLRRTPVEVRTISAVVLATLAWLTAMGVWWSGTTAFVGIAAAWLGGLFDRDGGAPRPVARVAGRVGLFAALLNALLMTGGAILEAVGIL